MSLINRPVTAATQAASRANGRLSQGPVTPEGLERCRTGNLRHGFYSQELEEALGEGAEGRK